MNQFTLDDHQHHHRPKLGEMAGERTEQQATETSPLLGAKQDQPIDPGAGLAPEGPQARTIDDYGTSAPDDEPAEPDGDPLERQESVQGRSKQYEGIPEMRKQLKFIVPAVAIGVFLGSADQTIVVSSYGIIGTDLDALNLTSWVCMGCRQDILAFSNLTDIL